MHELVLRIKDPDLCYVFATNAQRRGHPELALQAYRLAVDLRAQTSPANEKGVFAGVRAFFAYEEALSYMKGKRTRATGTWQMIKRHGVLPVVHKRIDSRSGEDVSSTLKELGMEDYSFKAVCDAYPDAFGQIAA